MTRAHMADPYLVAKLRRNEEHRIRPCVGLGYCVDRVNQGKDAVCGHNAATGREATLPHVIRPSLKKLQVIVVGGGVAGMEAARVCAERGHQTTLFEASNRLGGQLNLASKGVTRKQLIGIAKWLESELSELAVDLRLNQYIEAEDIKSMSAGLVIIATGGWPALPNIEGAEHLISSWDVLGRNEQVAGKVLLMDEAGDQATGVCADVLLRQKCSVVLTTPDRMILQELGPTNSSVVLRDLLLQGLHYQCHFELEKIELNGNDKKVTLKNVLTNERVHQTYDHVVVENGTHAIDDIYHELKVHAKNAGQLDHEKILRSQNPFPIINEDGEFFLVRIGDAISGRNIHAAILDALRIGVTG